jgi:hypothetical protein
MNKQQETPEQSAEMREVIETITTALIKSGQEARKLAEMTGTPLVVRNSKTLHPASSDQQQNGYR